MIRSGFSILRSLRSLFSRSVFAIPVLWLLIFFVIPISYVWIFSFSNTVNIIDFELTWTWEHYKEAFEVIYLKIIFKSIKLAGATTLISLVVGVVVAMFIAFNTSVAWRNFFLLLVILPFWTNMLIRTYALIAFLRGNGYLNDAYHILWDFTNIVLIGVGLDGLGDFVPMEILYNNKAVIFGLVYVHLPFMILPIYSALDKMDKSIIEASFDLGAGRIKTVFTIILPKISEGIYAGVLITFIPALGSFLIPDLLGGNDSQMIANVIERQFKSANNWPFGSALSFLLMYLLFFIVAVKSLMQSRRKKIN